ncbi:MAG: transporter substrate-binding domain-containing protein [Helicobacteraceae bacterium]|nr:transporter substrate-binding domain-containing protein [Helicobacteraceae bacterium]
MLKIFTLLLLLVITTHASQKLEKVSLQLQWKHQFEFAGFYAAKEKGFYKDVGLDVDFIEFNNSTNITQMVLDDKAQYGISYSSIVADYLSGKPVVLIANFFKQSPLILVAQEYIKTPADLKGKKVMGVQNQVSNITILNMLKKFNISSEDVVIAPATFSIDDFAEKKLDAMRIYTTNELYYLNKKNIPYRVFQPLIYGSKDYDSNLFTSKKELKEHPQRVENFRNASIKGWEYALSHKDEIIKLILEKYNTQNKSYDALSFEARQVEDIVLADIHKVGSVDKFRIATIADNFIHSNLIKISKDIDLNKFIYTTQYDQLELTKKEIAYLNSKNEITMCVDPNWMPLEKLDNGKHIGMSADYFKLFSNRIGVPIKVINTTSWEESLKFSKEKKCDILSLVMPTKEREKYLNFTAPYLNIPLILATKLNVPFLNTLDTLTTQKIGITKGYAFIEILKHKYPLLNIIEVKNIKDGLSKVNSGELFGYVGALSSVGYEFQHEFTGELKISGKFDEKWKLSIGVRDDDIDLLNILNKTVNSITDEQSQNILNKWVSIKYEKGIDYKLVKQLIALFVFILLIIIFFFIRERRLAKKIELLNSSLELQVALQVKEIQKQNEQLLNQSRLAQMGELINMIAHQWRQPLTAISARVNNLLVKVIMKKEVKAELLQQELVYMDEYTQHLSKTINDFRDFFSEGKKSELTTLKNIVEKTLNIVQLSIESKNIKIILSYSDDVEFKTFTNEVKQVLLNIIKNAEDALLEKDIFNPTITINTLHRDNVKILIISDNAGGIDESIIDQIFEPYFSTKKSKNGTGLGLYMSKIIIEDHCGGKLRVRNINNGAEFSIEL